MTIDSDANRAGTLSGVRLEENRLLINNVSLESATAAGVLRRFPPDEWVSVVGRMIDDGAGAFEAAYTNSTLQLVTQQLETCVSQMQQAMADTYAKGWRATEEALRKMLAEQEKALGKYLDGNSKTGVQAQMTEVFDKAGQTLFSQVAKAFEDGDESALGRYLAKFRKEVQTGFASLAAQQAVKHHKETATTVAGVLYEEAALGALAELARGCGDVPDHCGTVMGQLRKRNGDIVVRINEELTRGADLRIVWELKRRAEGSQPFSAASIRSSLKLARDNRGAQAGVFLVEGPALLPGWGGEFLELGHANFATVFTPGGSALGLQVAYRLARVAALADALRGDGVGIDLEAARRAVTDVRQAMTCVEQVRTQHASAIGAINRAGSGVQDLADSVLSALRRLDDIVGA